MFSNIKGCSCVGLLFQIHFLDFSAPCTPSVPIIHFEFAWVKRIRCSERGPLIGLIDFSLAFRVYCIVNCNSNSRMKEFRDTVSHFNHFCYRGSARKPWGWQHRTRAICTKANLVRWDLFSSERHFQFSTGWDNNRRASPLRSYRQDW